MSPIDHQPRAASESEAAGGLMPSHGISINMPTDGPHDYRPHPIKHMSAPAYQSPIRHHRRAPSRSKAVKETLNARSHYGSSDDDGAAIHRINQYIIKTEIGRGSFGAVHLAIDQYGHEYAVKEFSKSRLRKRAQSSLLRKPNFSRRPGPGHLAARMSFNSPLHRHSSSDMDLNDSNSLDLIKEEIAIMKKLDHPNLVSLIEVLDDPDEDSLYMVLEMCKKGVVMKVGLDDRAEPYADEACRCWFRDMILGIEYLHAQGIIHRDLKPDNCLITHDDVLKVVDFGVSEMFEKESDMATAKSAGSPAFMPPELCVAKHGQVSGRAADIWSMGVTLYCLRYGHIPFEKPGMLELYECIRNDDVPLHDEKDPKFEDLMRRMLEKDPEKRITMEQLREHPWVTRDGADRLLPTEENCAVLVEPPTEIEMNHAITGNMGRVMVVMKAVKRFKDLLIRKRPALMEGIFGRESRFVAPPHSVHGLSKSVDTFNRQPIKGALVVEGIHQRMDGDQEMRDASAEFDRLTVQSPVSTSTSDAPENIKTFHQTDDDDSVSRQAEEILEDNRRQFTHVTKSRTFPVDDHAKGHAHDPLQDTLFLSIGAGADASEQAEDFIHPVVSESPGAVEENIYEQAYQEELQRIQDKRGSEAAMHLNRRIEHIETFRKHPNVLASSLQHIGSSASRAGAFASKLRSGATGGFSSLVKEAMVKSHHQTDEERAHINAIQKPDEHSDNSGHAPVADPSAQHSASAGAQKTDPECIDNFRAHAAPTALHASADLPTPPGGFPSTS